MPNCTQDISSARLEFGHLGRRVIEGRFDGGNMTSDGGVMLLAKLDQRLGLTDAAARSIADPREPSSITHSIRDMLRQRVYGLVQGWEDLNNHTQLRRDIAYQSAVGREDDLASAPTLCRLEKLGTRAVAIKLHEVLVDQFIKSFKIAPEELVLDFDATDCPLYGKQEDRFFHGYAACPREGGEQLLLPAAVCLLWRADAGGLSASRQDRWRKTCGGDSEIAGDPAAAGVASGENYLPGRRRLLSAEDSQLV